MKFGGGYDKLFSISSLNEISILSQSHRKDKIMAGDGRHLKVIVKMNKIMKDSIRVES
jgi:hypothetical protein